MKDIKGILRSIKCNINNMKMKAMFRKDSQGTVIDKIKSKGLKSDTEYLIYVELNKFRTNVFKNNGNQWSLVNSYICSIGKPSTPTPKGTFKVGVKGPSFGTEHGYICYYYTQIKANYLFHSIIYNLNGTIRDGRLGMRISDGCIRLAKVNAKWIHDNVPRVSTIYIE